MSSTTPLTDAINALTTYANEITGQNDTNLSDAVGSLVDGYGSNEEFVKVSNGTITRIDNSELTNLRRGAFAYLDNLTYVNLPNVVSGMHNLFNADRKLVEIHMPKHLGNLGNSSFFQCYSLVTMDIPLLNQSGDDSFAFAPLTNVHILPNYEKANGQRIFRNATFTVMVFPKLQSTKTNFMLNCNSIVSVDFGANFSSITAQMLNKNAVLENIIFRRTSVVSLTNANGLWGDSNEPSVHKKIWVPSATISSYQSASNWSTLYDNGYITFHAIEGSIYETQYADGTPISTT